MERKLSEQQHIIPNMEFKEFLGLVVQCRNLMIQPPYIKMSLLSDETITTVIKVALHGRKEGGTSILCHWFCISCIVSSPCSRTSWMVVIMWCDLEQKTWPHHVFVTFHYCVVVVTVSGNLYWKKKKKNHCNSERLRLQWTVPQKTACFPASEVSEGLPFI